MIATASTAVASILAAAEGLSGVTILSAIDADFNKAREAALRDNGAVIVVMAVEGYQEASARQAVALTHSISVAIITNDRVAGAPSVYDLTSSAMLALHGSAIGSSGGKAQQNKLTLGDPAYEADHFQNGLSAFIVNVRFKTTTLIP